MTSFKIFIIIGALFLNVNANKDEDVVRTLKRNIKIISVGYHSDTCDDCNILKAKMKKMNRKFLTSPIIFIKYNKTTKKTQAKSEKKLKKWGMLTIAKKEEGLKHVVLYNAKTKEAIVTLFHTDSINNLERKIKDALIGMP
jgi:hypothetical protein